MIDYFGDQMITRQMLNKWLVSQGVFRQNLARAREEWKTEWMRHNAQVRQKRRKVYPTKYTRVLEGCL
jgi:hypothetical protein